MKEYESVLGQHINFQKPSIQFGHKVEESVRQEIQAILRIHTIGVIETYLGIHRILGGSKTQIFGFVHERLNNQVNGWMFKFFTKGGQEVIVSL